MAEFAVAHQIDHDVFLEGSAVVQRDLGGVAHGFRVVAVHVQNRRAHHLGDVGAIQGGAGVARIGSGEAHLVVDHEVDGAAGAVAAGLRHIEGGLVHAQADEGRVAVGKDGQHLFTAFGTAVVLAGAYGAFNHGVGDFQVRGVVGQRQVHGAVRGGHVGAEAHVVFHVATGEFGVHFAFELVENGLRGFAHGVYQHV